MKKLIKNWALKSLIKAVIPEDIIIIRNGIVYLNGEQIGESELKELKREASLIKELRLWKILTNTLRSDAQERMYNKAVNFDDMMAGKLLLYAIDLQEKIVNKLDNLKS